MEMPVSTPEKTDGSDGLEAIAGPPAMPSAERTEASDREAYEKLTGRSIDATPEPEADADAPEAPVEAAAPSEAPSAPVLAVEAPEASQEPAAPARSSDAEKARNFLKLKGAPEGAMNNLSDEDLAAWRSQILEREVGIDRTYSEVSELREQVKQLQATTEAATESEQGLPADDVDFSKEAKALTEQLGGDEEMTRAFEAMMKKANSPLAAQLKETRDQLAAQQQQTLNGQVDTAFQALGDRFPGLADTETRAKVRATAEQLAGMDRYQEGGSADEVLARLLADAATLEGVAEGKAAPGAPKKRDAKETEPPKQEGKDGQQSLPEAKPLPRERTPEQRDRAYFAELQRHPLKSRRERVALAQAAAEG